MRGWRDDNSLCVVFPNDELAVGADYTWLAPGYDDGIGPHTLAQRAAVDRGSLLRRQRGVLCGMSLFALSETRAGALATQEDSYAEES
jgi:hypothetical protein